MAALTLRGRFRMTHHLLPSHAQRHSGCVNTLKPDVEDVVRGILFGTSCSENGFAKKKSGRWGPGRSGHGVVGRNMPGATYGSCRRFAGSGALAIRAGYRGARATERYVQHGYILRFVLFRVYGPGGPVPGYFRTPC